MRVTLSTVGILQYIALAGRFLLGVLAYGEPFDRTRLLGFGVVWLALLIYAVEGVVERKRSAS